MVTCPRSHNKCVVESGPEGRWTGQLGPTLHPADSCKAVVAPTQGGLSPHWALVTLIVTQPCGWLFDACPPCQAVSALETEARGQGELVSVSPRTPRRGGCSVEVPWAEECISQRVPGSARLWGAKTAVRAPGCSSDPLSWLLEGLSRNSSGQCSTC